jgi:hypothetical protein
MAIFTSRATAACVRAVVELNALNEVSDLMNRFLA